MCKGLINWSVAFEPSIREHVRFVFQFLRTLNKRGIVLSPQEQCSTAGCTWQHKMIIFFFCRYCILINQNERYAYDWKIYMQKFLKLRRNYKNTFCFCISYVLFEIERQLSGVDVRIGRKESCWCLQWQGLKDSTFHTDTYRVLYLDPTFVKLVEHASLCHWLFID